MITSCSASADTVRAIDCGVMSFREALTLQERLVSDITAGNGPEILLLLEHEPVYTIGRGGNSANLLEPDLELIRTNRGGDITWHGPGQLVGYPLVNLGARGKDLHRFLRFIEELIILAISQFGVTSRRIDGKTGVWTEGGKVASIGIGVRNWVTMHGFALNVTPDLAPFSRINPCGMPRCPVTSLQKECGVAPPLEQVKSSVAFNFSRLLDERLSPVQQSDRRLLP